MPWYRKNSATNQNVAGGINNWRQIANLYRRNGSGNWEQIKRVYRKNSNNNPNVYQGPGAWVLVHNSDTLNPYNTVTPEFTTNTGGFHDTAIITLTRGTWANTGSAYAPITYDLDIQYSTDNVNWTNMVTGSGTTLTYTITSNDVSPPSYYFRGRVRVKNSTSVYSGYITVYATERSYRDVQITDLFTTMNGHNYQASWTLSKNNNSTNVSSQTLEIRTNDSFTHNGISYAPYSLVYSLTVPAGTGIQQINFLNANIKQNQSYYTRLIVFANDSDLTESYEIGPDFIYQGIPVIAPFEITSFTKGFPNASSQGVARSTVLNWSTATNASKYSVEYQGKTTIDGEWSNMEIFIPFIYAPTTSDTKQFASGQTPTYATFIRARIRASNDQGSTMIYNTPVNGSSYIEATGTPPGQPTFGTITKTDVSASVPVTASSTQGSNYRYEQMEYQYRRSFESYPSTWSTQGLSSGSGTISLSNLSSNQLYYIRIRNRNQDELYSSENETTFQTNAPLTGATSTSVSVSRLNDTTVRTIVSSSGASGPYYQMYWTQSATPPSTANYDAASISSTVTDDWNPPSDSTYYFYVRSSSENLGNTTTAGTATSGTYSSYGPSSGAASYYFLAPSGSVSVSPSSGTAGTTQFSATPSVSASPSPEILYQWQYFEGGALGWLAITNATSSTYTPPSNYTSIYGTSLRCRITATNGVGQNALVANSSSVTVAAPGVAPSGGGVTLSPSGTQQAGTTLTANVSAMSGTATISYQTYIVKKTGSSPTSDTDGTRVASGTGTGNVATHTITASEASGTPDQFRAFTTGTNSFGSNSVASNTVISTPAVVTQYTINWNANGGSVSPPSNTVNSGTSVSAPTPTLSGYTFLYWRDSPNAFSYVYQINPGGSWTVNSNITFYAYWQQNAVAAPTITSGPGISWGSGNNFTLSATASNATNLEFQVQFANTSGGTVQNTQTYFFGASTGGGTTGAQSYPWARTRVRANNTSTGQSSAFTAYSGWA